MAKDVLEQLRELGLDPSLVSEVERGFAREADYTRKTQELARMREEAAYLLGQGRGGGAPGAAPKSKLEQFFDSLPDTAEASGARELFMGALGAFREDYSAEQQQSLKPVLNYVAATGQAQALDARLESELKPMFGDGFLEIWPQVREQMLSALNQNQLVDPVGFVFRAMPEKAQALIQSRLESQQQQKQDSTGEGFASIRSDTPAMTPAGGGSSSYRNGAPGNGAATPENGAPKRPSIPTVDDMRREFMAVASDVGSGNVPRN
jgi:hypothetical protein